MKFNNSLKLSTVLLLALPLATSCYKEDAQELYSRQYVNSVSLQQLNATADSLNTRIHDVQKVVEVLRQRKPVYKLAYNVVNGDTLGANLTLDELVAYIPFGRDGKNGRDGKDGKDGKDGTQITVSADGFWVINGQKTDVRAQGRDGKDGANGKEGTQITVSADGFWVIDGQKTNLRAQGRDGKDGRNGADGKAPVISIGANGNWLIDGEDTGHSSLGQKGDKGDQGEKGADGQKGQTPQFSLRENPDDAADPNIYWYITYPDGTGDFLLFDGERVRATGEKGEKGDQGDQGPQGTPGVNSPITHIAYGPGNKSLVINTTLPGLSSVSIPLRDLRFDIQPETLTTAFDVTLQQLTFAPGEMLTFSFTKDEALTIVSATLPTGWQVNIDAAAKTIALTAPTDEALASVDNLGQATFFARSEKGETYSRAITVLVPKKLEIGYYYTANTKLQIDRPNSVTNELDLSAEKGNFQHFFLLASQTAAGGYQTLRESNQSYTPAQLTAMFKKNDFVSLDKDASLDNKHLRVVDLFYKADSVRFERIPGNPERPDQFMLYPSKVYPDDMNQYVRYLPPIPWNTFAAYRTFETHNGHLREITRLKRLPMRVHVEIKGPKKVFNLGAGEEIDPSRVIFSHASSYGLDVIGNAPLYADEASPARKIYVTRAENVAYYDEKNDILYADFAAAPVYHSSLLHLGVEYRRADGTIFNHALSTFNAFPSIIPGNGGVVRYVYFVKHGTKRIGLSYLQVISSSGEEWYDDSNMGFKTFTLEELLKG